MRLATLLLALSATVSAQFAPWNEGDLIVHVADPQKGNTIRVFDPLSGNGHDIFSGFGGYFGAGWMAYDSYRHGLVMATTGPGEAACLPSCLRLWLVDAAGNATSLGLAGQPIRGLAPTGDGRIYFRRTTTGQPSNLEYLDANGAVHTVMDGAVPYVTPWIDHMIYVPSQQALIATMTWGSPGSCNGDVWHLNIFRIPLTADGSALAGPVTCALYQGGGASTTGIDHLPGGNVLFSVTHGGAGGLQLLGAVNPTLPTESVWATMDFPASPYNGGAVWSPLLGKAVVIDRMGEVLRLFSPGDNGPGALLPTSLKPHYATGGWGTATRIVDVHDSGPGCDGFLHSYGSGLAGANGHVPVLGGDGCPSPGALVTLHVDGVIGGALGTLFVGLTPAAVPFKGGSFLVGNVVLTAGIGVSGPLAVPGAGSLDLPAVLPNNPLLQGVSLYLQAAFQDAFAVKGVSLTNGLQLAIE